MTSAQLILAGITGLAAWICFIEVRRRNWGAAIVGGKIAVDAIRGPQAQEMSQMVLEAVRKKLNEER